MHVCACVFSICDLSFSVCMRMTKRRKERKKNDERFSLILERHLQFACVFVRGERVNQFFPMVKRIDQVANKH